MKIIIDGYNLMHTWGWMPRQNHRQSLQQGRNRMLQRLADLVPVGFRSRITIVFDAGQSHRASRPEEASRPSGQDHYGFEICFAADYDEADTMIEEMILRSANPQSLLIISSDQRLIQAAQRRKARPIRSQDCLDELEQFLRSAARTGLSESAEPRRLDGIEEKRVSAELLGIDWVAEFQLDISEDPEGKKEQSNPAKPSNRQKKSPKRKS
jgi:predicted RNA-binding protein with PIN domain